jgi:UDP-galactose transporter
MHYSRIMPLVHGLKYIPSTAVLSAEVLKFTISLTMALYEVHSKVQHAAATTLFSTLASSIFSGDSWKLAIPAILYNLQNSLQYIGASNLDASTLQITYQLKILTTAMFSVTLLRRKLSTRKWLSLLLLAVGVAFVQVPLARVPQEAGLRGEEQKTSWLPQFITSWLGPDQSSAIMKRSATYQGINADYKLHNPTLNGSMGLVAVLVACMTSGLAGVYFEKILKDQHNLRGQDSLDDRPGSSSIWIRNTQLSFYSLFPALFVGVIFNDGAEIARQGFFGGYNWIVVTVVLLQAFGGILVSMVIKYADNIAKNFATSIGIVISFTVSFLFLDLEPSVFYIAGAGTVVSSTWLYNSEPIAPAPFLVVEDYDYGQSAPTSERGYFDDGEATRASRSRSKKVEGLSTSRPGTPVGSARTTSQRRLFQDKQV